MIIIPIESGDIIGTGQGNYRTFIAIPCGIIKERKWRH
jgi:hypothetical protein